MIRSCTNLRRSFAINLKRSPEIRVTTISRLSLQENIEEENIALEKTVKAKTIRELREIKEEYENDRGNQAMDYIHLNDPLLSEVDPNRTNYFVNRNSLNPPLGEVDVKTRRKIARIKFSQLIFQATVGVFFASFGLYSVFFSGYDCALEANTVAEDPTYAGSMINNMKWRNAMETYYTKNSLPIPWNV
ncbi:unnamed protein product [Oikopleura dioica]|uniref:Uncharacterized protein n=1 Tax=Oikopleura dioica TaxID=34765 RepID=E4YD88_OIKDI|nr:unnamed protein product [Oikopleura dioica]